MKSDLIRRVPLFATLSDSEFDSLQSIFLIRSFNRNQIIFLEEETGKYMYIVLAGKVKVTKSTSDGKETVLAVQQEGDFFGEMALLDGKTAPATVAAMEDCRIAMVSGSDFHQHLMRNEKVMQQIIQVLCSRLRQVWARIQSLSYSTADARIRGTLFQLSRKHGISDEFGIVIDLKITHQELAGMVGTSRETVSRTLSQLQRDGIIRTVGRRITILDPKALLPIA
jgi:CRP/FNR family transcriptional regulator, cyclic AMP receptor protein